MIRHGDDEVSPDPFDGDEVLISLPATPENLLALAFFEAQWANEGYECGCWCDG